MSAKKRIAGLDILRSWAIFLVIFVHFFYNTKFYETPLVGWNMILQTYLRWVVLVSVPVFIMLTGYLSIQKDISRNYYKGIWKVIIPYLIYSLISIIYRITFLHESRSITEWVMQIIQFKADGYAWYVEMYIGLFLMVPFLNRLRNTLNKQEQHILIITLLFLTIRFDLLTITPQFWMNLYPVSYYFLGAYIKEFQPQIDTLKGWGLFFVISLVYLFIPIVDYGGSDFEIVFGKWGSLPIVVSSVLFFLLFYQSDIKNRFLKKMVSMVSLVSFDMYLVSFVIDGIVYTYFMDKYFTTQEAFFPYVFIVVPLVFVISFSVGLIRFKLSNMYTQQRIK